MADFLFELGVEEVPVSEIRSIRGQLEEKFKSELELNLVEYQSIESSSTNTRFMVYIKEIKEKANDKEEFILGPSKKVGFSDDGAPTIALTKFLASHDCTVRNLVEIEQKKGIYLGIKKKVTGQPVPMILERIIPKILSELTFKKAMVWNSSRIPFVRPIINILALFNSDLIELEFAGIESSNIISGHNLLSEDSIEVESFKNYIEQLGNNFVIGKDEERREKILDEIRDIEEESNVRVRIDEVMLEYYTYNNEYPVVFYGEFDPKYLQIPEEIISTFMVNEKKLVPVYGQDGKMVNMFVGVSNVPDESRFVAEGNKRVVVATFEDAKFFWDKDRQDNFYELRDELKNVLFHKKIGTFYEKTERLIRISEAVAKFSGHEDLSEPLKKAASLSKNDLVTRMVREFPSLQGIMGGLYLNEKKESETVWKAVYGQYEPKGYTEEVIENLEGGLFSLADKIDSIVGFIGSGIKISSSKDPYGIRRDANGILKIIIDLKLDFDLMELISLTIDQFGHADEKRGEILQAIQAFFIQRIKGIFKDNIGYRYDVVNSILVGDKLNVYKLFLKGKDIHFLIEKDSVNSIIALHKRLRNIIKDQQVFQIQPDLLVDAEEKILFDIYNESKTQIVSLIAEGQHLEAFSKIMEMKPIIDSFFDKVLVMADDMGIRNNRVALISGLEKILFEIADFSQLVEN